MQCRAVVVMFSFYFYLSRQRILVQQSQSALAYLVPFLSVLLSTKLLPLILSF